MSSRTCAIVRVTSKRARATGGAPSRDCFAAPLHIAATLASKACVLATVLMLCGLSGRSSVST